MAKQRDIRRLAMQLLYEFDVRGEEDWAALGARGDEGDDEAFDPEAVREAAFSLAERAWGDHAAADALVTELAPTWPTHRQPPVDRAILRLCYHEMASGRTPAKVAINEAIELAKRYAAEQSPAFLNGVLDKIAKRLASHPLTPNS